MAACVTDERRRVASHRDTHRLDLDLRLQQHLGQQAVFPGAGDKTDSHHRLRRIENEIRGTAVPGSSPGERVDERLADTLPVQHDVEEPACIPIASDRLRHSDITFARNGCLRVVRIERDSITQAVDARSGIHGNHLPMPLQSDSVSRRSGTDGHNLDAGVGHQYFRRFLCGT